MELDCDPVDAIHLVGLVIGRSTVFASHRVFEAIEEGFSEEVEVGYGRNCQAVQCSYPVLEVSYHLQSEVVVIVRRTLVGVMVVEAS